MTKGGFVKSFFSRYKVLFTAGLLATSVALASSFDIAKINKIIDDIAKKALVNATIIQDVSFVLDDSTDVTNDGVFLAGDLSATARSSVWSKSATSLQVSGSLLAKKVPGGDENPASGSFSVSSQTDALALYRYLATEFLKKANAVDDDQGEAEFAKDIKKLLREATSAGSIDAVFAQLTQLKTLLLKAANDPVYAGEVLPPEFLETIQNITLANNNGTIIISTTEEISAYGIVLVPTLAIAKSNMMLKVALKTLVSEKGLQDFSDGARQFLGALQSEDPDTLLSITEMVKDYIRFAEEFLNGKNSLIK